VRILHIVNPATPIPPVTMGGLERIVHSLIVELQALGHEITLLAEDTSQPPEGVQFHGIGTYWHKDHAVAAVWKYLLLHGHRYDAIHNHGRLLFHLPSVWSRTSKVHTFYFGELQVPQVQRFVSLRPRNFVFAPCGDWIAEKYRGLGGSWTSVHSGLSEELYTANYDVPSDAPLVSLGRMDPRKGAPQAIEVARKTGRKLVIAGVIGDQPHEKAWFETQVLRHCDGDQIRFIGSVNDREKQELLGSAAALLLPIQGSEAFTVVMIEALACGCPVVGYNQYCIPELVRDGYNGFLANDVDDMAQHIHRLGEIDRRNCRRDFEERFSARVMAAKFVDLYTHTRGCNS